MKFFFGMVVEYKVEKSLKWVVRTLMNIVKNRVPVCSIGTANGLHPAFEVACESSKKAGRAGFRDF